MLFNNLNHDVKNAFSSEMFEKFTEQLKYNLEEL
jgi:hypothetical protein